MNYWEDEKIVKRFFDKVNKNGENGCWNWIACCNKDGYGSIKTNGNTYLAHRVSFEIANKRFITESLLIRHTCIGNRKCVNPAHLLEGTNQDNSNDKCSQNRQTKGESIHHSKLTEKQILEIRQKYSEDEKGIQKKLAEEYDVSPSQISKIVNGKHWKHLNK